VLQLLHVCTPTTLASGQVQGMQAAACLWVQSPHDHASRALGQRVLEAAYNECRVQILPTHAAQRLQQLVSLACLAC
jgi:hypothetical protein